MIGGNIPEETRVISIAIFDQVETLKLRQGTFFVRILVDILFSCFGSSIPDRPSLERKSSLK